MTAAPGPGDCLVVVAAGPGLGRAVARRFAHAGATVGLIARGAGRLEELADELRADGATVAVAVADVADPRSLRRAFTTLRQTLGDPTVLAFNASEWVEGSALSVDHEAFVHGLQVGLAAALVSAQAVAPAMRAAGRGTILLTGSVAAEQASLSAATVGVAKAGLRSYARSLHRELAPDGVLAVTVTIRGVLQGPKALDVDEIAELYWGLHTAPRSEWTADVSFPGEEPAR